MVVACVILHNFCERVTEIHQLHPDEVEPESREEAQTIRLALTQHLYKRSLQTIKLQSIISATCATLFSPPHTRYYLSQKFKRGTNQINTFEKEFSVVVHACTCSVVMCASTCFCREFVRALMSVILHCRSCRSSSSIYCSLLVISSNSFEEASINFSPSHPARTATGQFSFSWFLL